MASIDQIVSVIITQQTASVAQPSFAVPLLLSKKDPGWPAGDVVHTYSTPAGMLSDGFTANDAEYTAALAMYAQTVTPTVFKVARRTGTTMADYLAAAAAADSGWYGLAIVSATDTEILTAAAWVEGNQKLYVAVSGTTAIGSSATTDVGTSLKTAGYTRTALLFSPAGYSAGIDAAWLGSQLAQTPGSNTWAYKTLAGVPTDNLTATQVTACIGTPTAGVAGKNVNIYQSVGGVPVTQMGTAASGQFIDITVGIDWFRSTLQTNVYRALQSAQKVPYTDDGVAVLISAARAAIDQGVANGLIDGRSTISVTAPLVATVSANQRANRVAPTITFSCRLQGALHAAVIQGTVSV